MLYKLSPDSLPDDVCGGFEKAVQRLRLCVFTPQQRCIVVASRLPNRGAATSPAPATHGCPQQFILVSALSRLVGSGETGLALLG